MTVFLDSSALLSVAIEGRGRQVVLDILESEADWCASAFAGLALAVAMLVIFAPWILMEVLR